MASGAAGAGGGLVGTAAAFWPLSSWPVTFVACSGGFNNILYTFGLGYGVSMLANAGLSVAVARHQTKAPLTPYGAVCCGLYAAYGLRLSSFMVRRQSEESFAPRIEHLQLKSDMMGPAPKFAIVTGVSFAQALYALPLAVATSQRAKVARPALRLLGWAGVGLAAAGLVIESVADEQKLLGKRERPNAPVMDGLYASCRHPNYFGEILFHVGISCMGLSGTPLQVAACIFPTFFMAFTLQNAARRADKEADHKYKSVEGYAAWAQGTPVLMPDVRRLIDASSSSTPTPGGAA